MRPPPNRFDWHPEPDLVDFASPSARQALERLGEATWREALDWLYGVAMQRPMPADTYPQARARYFDAGGGPAPAPNDPATSAEVLAEFRTRIAPFTFNAQHPGSFSYFTPPPLPASIVGEVLGQWIHQGVDVWHAGPIAAFVEEEVTAWLRDLCGIGSEGWGILASGGVMANIMAMTVARDVHLRDLRGLEAAPRGAGLEDVRVYVSDQAHFSIGRALDMLGFPAGTLRVLRSDDHFRLRAEPVEEAVAADRAAGLTPLAVAAVAGSTNTGAVDDVPALAALAEREGMWLHVDAAYGGAARLSAREAHRVPGLELADSITVDPHKWFFQAYDIGGLVVRRRDDLHRTFHVNPEYYRAPRPEERPLDWYQYSLEGTRRFRALKLWTSWKHLGTRGFGSLIDHNVDLAHHLARRLRTAGFEVVDPALSIVCFRWPGGDDTAQDALQRALEERGEGWVSTTVLRGRTFLRAGVVNYLSTEVDADRVVDALTRHAAALT
jgi:aromatic-L-amino-acid/L-tryptophan decarboxylase